MDSLQFIAPIPFNPMTRAMLLQQNKQQRMTFEKELDTQKLI